MFNNAFKSALTIVAILVPSALAFGQQVDPAKAVGKKIPSVHLNDFTGRRHALDDFRGEKATVIVFLSFDCPVSNSYIPTLNRLAKQYGSHGVRFLGLYPLDDAPSQLAKEARRFEVSFPVLHDPQLIAARLFTAVKVPEVFVLDADGVVRYRGRIDDSYYARLKKKTFTRHYDLKNALDAVLAGKQVPVTVTEAIGCPIIYSRPEVKSTEVTFYRDVLPILQRRCQECHRPGEVGPFSLLTYRHAVTWGEDIKEYTRTRKMPPWLPTDGVPFRNERKLTQAEIDILARWVDNGMPAGDPKTAPPPRKFANGWKLGQPDLVLEPKGEVTIGADGSDLFRCFVLPTGLDEDKYVVAYEVRPGNPRVVHHTVHFLDTLGRGRRIEALFQKMQKPGSPDYGPGYNSRMGPGFFPPSGAIGGWAPGISPHFMNGVGYYLPKNADIVMQIHYHRTGRVEKDRTKLGLYFAKSGHCQPLQTLVVPGRFLFIPAGNRNYKVQGDMWVASDCTIYTVTPHMHQVGKAIKATMTPPGGKTITLIDIPKWDYNWQEIYHLAKPIHVPAGTRFHVEAIYDNSTENPYYPFKENRVVFAGDQTNNEMCFVFLGLTTDDGSRAGMRLWRGGPVIRPQSLLPQATAARR